MFSCARQVFEAEKYFPEMEYGFFNAVFGKVPGMENGLQPAILFINLLKCIHKIHAVFALKGSVYKGCKSGNVSFGCVADKIKRSMIHPRHQILPFADYGHSLSPGKSC